MVLFLRKLLSHFTCCVQLNNIMNECTHSWVSLPGFRFWLCHCYMILDVFVQSLSRVWLFATPRTAVHQGLLYFTVSWRLLKLMFIEWVMPSNHLILCRPLLLLPLIFPSRVFSSESALCIRWPKYWSFSISPSHEYSGLTCFRMNWLDLLRLLLFWLPAQLIGSQLSENEGNRQRWQGEPHHQFPRCPTPSASFQGRLGFVKFS